VRCKDGKLVGATRSQHGYIVIQLFPLAENYEPNALAQGAVPPKPGRLFMNAIGQRCGASHPCAQEGVRRSNSFFIL